MFVHSSGTETELDSFEVLYWKVNELFSQIKAQLIYTSKMYEIVEQAIVWTMAGTQWQVTGTKLL